MSYHYTDESRASDPHALPDVEVIEQSENQCDKRGHPYHDADESCLFDGPGFYYAHGFPGCLWDSDPVGPFDTEAEALKEAREAAGF